jgi:hypothetical protein
MTPDETTTDQPAATGPVPNADLEHSEGGRTTRDDPSDLGVPMTQGQPGEPQGPEDALGLGVKRGDYRDRVDPAAHEAVALPGGGEPVYAYVKDGVQVEEGTEGATRVQIDVKPRQAVLPQAPRADDIGDAPGKGGVTTAPTAGTADADQADDVADEGEGGEGESGEQGQAAA